VITGFIVYIFVLYVSVVARTHFAAATDEEKEAHVQNLFSQELYMMVMI
jgi:hypothetical protein